MSKISPSLKKLLNNLGVQKVVKVKIRKKGFSSRLPEGNCHSNVMYMVSKYGGRQVTGYAIHDETIVGMRGRQESIHHHSIWETPEGKLVDVTYSWKDTDEFLFAVIDRKSKDNQVLFPQFNFFITSKDKMCYLVKSGNQFPVIEEKQKKIRLLLKNPDLRNSLYSKGLINLSNID